MNKKETVNSQNKSGSRMSAKKIAVSGMLCAVAFVVMLVSKFIPDVEGFLSFGFQDIMIAISGFILGPLYAVAISVIVSVLEMLTVSGTGPIGLLMNVLSTCAFVCPAAAIYAGKKKYSAAVAGLAVGEVCMAAMMLLWNWLITPVYMGIDRSVVAAMLPTVFLPFNLLKGGINGCAVLLLYKPIISALRKAGLVRTSDSQRVKSRKTAVVSTVAVAVILAALIAAVIVWVSR